MKVLELFRREIDALDDQIVDLLSERSRIIREVAEVKSVHGIPAVLEDRVEEVKQRVAARGLSKGLDPRTMVRIWTILIDEACALEDSILARHQPQHQIADQRGD